MKRIMLITLALMIISVPAALAQLPGDFNCNGETFEIGDLTYLVHLTLQDVLDTSSCTWRNGDLNLDSLNHTIADWRQCMLIGAGDTLGDNPPMPNYLDSIIIGDVWAMPGESILMPVMINLAEPAFDISMHFQYDNTYLYNPILLDWSGQLLEPPIVRGEDIYWQKFPVGVRAILNPGRYGLAYLNLTLRENIPVDTSFIIQLVAGDYYPSGFANVSFPTYFIRPVLIGGTVHVTPTGIDDNARPEKFDLNLANYPNPFNAQTSIEYILPKSDNVSITIYDLLGRKTASLVNGFQSAGPHSILWDASSQPSGIYFYNIKACGFSETKKMTLLK